MGMYCDIFAVSREEAEDLLSNPELIEDFSFTRSVNVEKAWHGLHYLMTGSAWEGPEPLGFLVAGGTPIGEVDLGYGPARLFRPEEVDRLHAALAAMTEDRLWSRFDAGRMNAAQIYPGIWDEPESDLREEYLMYFRELKEFIADASRDRQALVIRLV